MSMIKLTYSSDISATVGVGGEIVKSASELDKQASTIFKCEYDALKPPKGMTGIHLVALGDSEAYPMNRNGDLFPKEACQKYYNTFVEHGHVFEHHRNKDPKKAIGQIKAAAYNPDMHRIELYIWADNEKAHDHLERLEKTGEVPFSMACVRAGTPILTYDGMKPVEMIKSGDVVLTHKGNWKRVSATMNRTVDQYCRVSFVSWGQRKLEITPNHQVYAASFEDIERSSRKSRPDHPCKAWRLRHRKDLEKTLKWIPAGELTKYHYMCVPLWSENPGGIGVDRARLYGYYIAEGSLGAGVTQITCNVNDCFVDEIEKLANWTSVKKKAHRLSPDKCVVLNCFGTDIRNELEQSCGKRCENKRIPMSVRHGSLEERFNFVSAWFNGDGWQDKTGMHWSIHPQNLANDLQVLLASMSVPSSCTKIMHDDNRGGISSKNPVEYVVSVSNEYSGLFADICKAKEMCISGSSKMRTFISGRYLFVPVDTVEVVNERTEVFNFSVDDDESYTVYGLAVHNCRVPRDRCSVCGALREKPGDASECDHIRFSLGKIAEDGTQIGTYNDDPDWFDISFVGRPADRLAWNLKVASAMPEDLTVNSSVKQAEIEGYTLPDALAIETDGARQKQSVMRKLAFAYGKLAAWIDGGVKPSGHERYQYELRKLAGAAIDSRSIARLREMDPSDAFAALGDAGIVMDVPTFFKYAFGPDYKTVEKYIPEVEKSASAVVCEAVESSSCADFCNCARFDARSRGVLSRSTLSDVEGTLSKSAAARGFGTEDAVTGVLEAMASGSAPEFGPRRTEKTASASDADPAVARKLARHYAMYKIAGLCAVMNGKCGPSLCEDDVVFVAAAQDMRVH